MDMVMPERESHAIFVIDIKISISRYDITFDIFALASGDFCRSAVGLFFSHVATLLFGKREIPANSGRT
jgi:hypothetical protein